MTDTLWHFASEEAQRDADERSLSLARVASAQYWSVIAKARDEEELDHAIGLVSNGVTAAVSTVAAEPAEVAVLASRALDSYREDWRAFHAALVAEGAFTRQHFNAIAKALHDYQTRSGQTIPGLADHFAGHLASGNDLFDPARFKSAVNEGTAGSLAFDANNMTKEHFQTLARAISSAPLRHRAGLANHFADLLAGSNPRFKRDVFMRAANPTSQEHGRAAARRTASAIPPLDSPRHVIYTKHYVTTGDDGEVKHVDEERKGTLTHADPSAGAVLDHVTGEIGTYPLSAIRLTHTGEPVGPHNLPTVRSQMLPVNRPSYADEPQEMTDVLGPRPPRQASRTALITDAPGQAAQMGFGFPAIQDDNEADQVAAEVAAWEAADHQSRVDMGNGIGEADASAGPNVSGDLSGEEPLLHSSSLDQSLGLEPGWYTLNAFGALIRTANKYIKQQGDKWVITQKGTGKVLSHHDSEAEAEASFRAMMQSKHGSIFDNDGDDDDDDKDGIHSEGSVTPGCPNCGQDHMKPHPSAEGKEQCPSCGYSRKTAANTLPLPHVRVVPKENQNRFDIWHVWSPTGVRTLQRVYGDRSEAENIARQHAQELQAHYVGPNGKVSSLRAWADKAPYYVRAEGGSFKVANRDGEVISTHDDRESARRKQASLYAAIPDTTAKLGNGHTASKDGSDESECSKCGTYITRGDDGKWEDAGGWSCPKGGRHTPGGHTAALNVKRAAVARARAMVDKMPIEAQPHAVAKAMLVTARSYDLAPDETDLIVCAAVQRQNERLAAQVQGSRLDFTRQADIVGYAPGEWENTPHLRAHPDIKRMMGRVHVSTPDEEVAQMGAQWAERNGARPGDPTHQQAIDDALAVHHHIQVQYAWVQNGLRGEVEGSWPRPGPASDPNQQRLFARRKQADSIAHPTSEEQDEEIARMEEELEKLRNRKRNRSSDSRTADRQSVLSRLWGRMTGRTAAGDPPNPFDPSSTANTFSPAQDVNASLPDTAPEAGNQSGVSGNAMDPNTPPEPPVTAASSKPRTKPADNPNAPQQQPAMQPAGFPMTMAPMMAAKLAIAHQVLADNPGMSDDEALHLATRTIERHPHLVHQAYGGADYPAQDEASNYTYANCPQCQHQGLDTRTGHCHFCGYVAMGGGGGGWDPIGGTTTIAPGQRDLRNPGIR